MTSGVYLIRCVPTQKMYIGSSKNVRERWTQHKCLLNKGKHHSLKLQRAWDKYGANSFEFFVIEQNPANLIDAEQRWINNYDAFNNGLNGCPIADKPRAESETPKTKSIKIRLEDWEYQKYYEWAEAYGDDLSAFFRRMLRSLPETPPEIPQPPVKL